MQIRRSLVGYQREESEPQREKQLMYLLVVIIRQAGNFTTLHPLNSAHFRLLNSVFLPHDRLGHLPPKGHNFVDLHTQTEVRQLTVPILSVNAAPFR